MLQLRNPHSILAVLQTRPAAVKTIRVSSDLPTGPWRDVTKRAKERGVAVEIQRSGLGRRNRERATERTGAGSAVVEPPCSVPFDQILDTAAASAPGIWLALDQIQDPQNLGAMFRLSGFFAVRGIVLTKTRSAPVNETVCDVAAGGVEYTPYSVVANLTQAFRAAQAANIWILGTCENAAADIRTTPRDRHWMLVFGNEAGGLRRLTREKCDEIRRMPATGPITSLNVAAAAAACLAILESRGLQNQP